MSFSVDLFCVAKIRCADGTERDGQSLQRCCCLYIYTYIYIYIYFFFFQNFFFVFLRRDISSNDQGQVGHAAASAAADVAASPLKSLQRSYGCICALYLYLNGFCIRRGVSVSVYLCLGLRIGCVCFFWRVFAFKRAICEFRRLLIKLCIYSSFADVCLLT